ncbi:MAG: hypothetical protein Ta2B_08310 [Termitinemataceae bacterium]|nr:MAG: hypothetical protein Ta2B_08310 [Termitinemataceae bacterium]
MFAVIFLLSSAILLSAETNNEPQYDKTATVTILELEGDGFNIKTLPARAKVYIDGGYKGLTPLKITKIGIGVHIIKITKDFFDDYSVKVALPADSCIDITVNLVKSIAAYDERMSTTEKKADGL